MTKRIARLVSSGAYKVPLHRESAGRELNRCDCTMCEWKRLGKRRRAAARG